MSDAALVQNTLTHTHTCARECSHKHSRHFLTGESGRNEPVQCICHRGRAHRRRNKSRVSYCNVDDGLSDAFWFVLCELKISGIFTCANIFIFLDCMEEETKKKKKKKEKTLLSALNIKQIRLRGNLSAQQSTAASSFVFTSIFTYNTR